MSSEVKELTQSVRALDQTIKQLLAAGSALASPTQKKQSRAIIPTGDLADPKAEVQQRRGEKV